MKFTLLVLVTLLLVSPILSVGLFAGEDKPAAEAREVKAQTTCPVMGGKINKALYVDHNGKRIYLCCKGCLPAVTKDPAKYIKQLEDKGITVADAPSAKKNDRKDCGEGGCKAKKCDAKAQGNQDKACPAKAQATTASEKPAKAGCGGCRGK